MHEYKNSNIKSFLKLIEGPIEINKLIKPDVKINSKLYIIHIHNPFLTW